MTAAASVLLGCLCVALLRHTSGIGVPTTATAARDDLTETADIVTATAATPAAAATASAASGASETTDTVSTTTYVSSIENLHGTNAIVGDAFATEDASTTATRRMATDDAPEVTATLIADVTDSITTGSLAAVPASAATAAREQSPTATEESTAWQETSPSDHLSWDNTPDVLFDLAGNISDSTSRRYVTELKERLGQQSAALRRDTQLAASSSETAVRLLAGDGGIQDTMQALQTGLARAEAERGALREDLTQLKTGQARVEGELGGLRDDLTQVKDSVAQLQSDQSRLMRLLVSFQQHHLLPTCPVGWDRRGTSCFTRHPEPQAWYDAEAICQRKHPQAHLASVHPDNAEHIRQLVEDYEGLNFWIGLIRHADPPGGWRWTDGTELDYTDWLPWEPNDAGGEEDCVHEAYQTSNGQRGWNDRDCSLQLSFICQIRASPSPIPA